MAELVLNCGDINQFSNWYITSQKPCCNQVGIVSTKEHTGTVTSAGVDNLPHRQYPTIQLYKYPRAVPAVNVSIDVLMSGFTFVGEANWVSLATFSSNPDDSWADVVTVNVIKRPDGKMVLNICHVPTHGQEVYNYRNTSILFPMGKWVHLDMYCRLGQNGFIDVRQGGKLVASADVVHPNSNVTQMHFGLYCAPAFTAGIVKNKNLIIRESV